MKGLMGILRDITGQKTADQVVKKATEELEDKVRERTNKLMISNKQLPIQILEHNRAKEQIQASLKEKELLILEIHHRVKNNLQIISSLLNLQASKTKNLKVLEMFKECQNRIHSMALTHEKLYLAKEMA